MSESPPSSSPESGALPLKGKIVSGSIWMIAMRWTMRFLGIVNVGILARLLEQEDFGLVAMASAVMALPVMLLDMGFENALIRDRSASKDDYNTAWTLRVLQMGFVAVLIFFTAPYIAGYYGDPRVEDICRMLSASILVQGLQNMWVVSFRKDFKFHADFLFNVSKKLLTTIVTIIFAFALQTYWALVYGQLTGVVIELLLSLLVVGQLPRPTLKAWRKLWGFARWNMAGSVAIYVYYNSDKLILGHFLPASLVGIFTVGREISDMPINEISAPLNRALGPGFAELQPYPERYASAVKKTWGAVATIVLPVSIGIAATASQIVPVLLGPNWEEAIPIIQLLSLSGILATLDGILTNILIVSGYVAFSAVRAWIRAVVVLLIAIPAVIHFGIFGMAAAQFLSSGSGLIPSLRYISKKTPGLTALSVVAGAVRPVCASIVMALCVLAWNWSDIEAPVLLLLCKVVTGAASYSLVLLGLWRMDGKPDTIERTVLNLGRSLLQRVPFLQRAG